METDDYSIVDGCVDECRLMNREEKKYLDALMRYQNHLELIPELTSMHQEFKYYLMNMNSQTMIKRSLVISGSLNKTGLKNCLIHVHGM